MQNLANVSQTSDIAPREETVINSPVLHQFKYRNITRGVDLGLKRRYAMFGRKKKAAMAYIPALCLMD